MPGVIRSRQTSKRIRAVCGTLSVLERNTILLLARGMTHEEIAFRFKVPVADVFEAAWRGRAKLEGRGAGGG